MKIEIQILESSDTDGLIELISVFEAVFVMENFKPPGKSYLHKLLNKENFFAVVAKLDNRIIAGLTVYLLDQYYAEKPLGYIYDLAVLTAYQRQGIGKKIIAFTTEYCRQKGVEEVFVQAEKEDEYAVNFYRSTRPSEEEQAVHFSYKL